MKLKQNHLLQHEQKIQTKGANAIISLSDYGLSKFVADGLMWTIGMKGQEAIGGMIHLTNYRLVFISHYFNRVRGSFSIFLPAIVSATDTSSGFVRTLTITTRYAKFDFVIWGIEKFQRQIMDAKANIDQNTAKKIRTILNSTKAISSGGMRINQGFESLNKVFLVSKQAAESATLISNPMIKISELLIDAALERLVEDPVDKHIKSIRK